MVCNSGSSSKYMFIHDCLGIDLFFLMSALIACFGHSWSERKIRSLWNAIELACVNTENLVYRFWRQRGQALAGLAHWRDETLGVRVVGADEKPVVARKAYYCREHPLDRICAHPDVVREVLGRG